MGDFSVQISADLVNRLIDDGVKLKKKAKRTKTKVPQEPPRPQTKARDQQHPDDSKARRGTASTGWPAQPPLVLAVTPPPVPYSNTELDAIQSTIQESEKVLEKLRKQEDNMVQEVTQRAKDLHDKEFKLPYQKPMPCLADYDACRACYKDFSDDILKCAPLTKSYYDCVQRAKQQASSTPK